MRETVKKVYHEIDGEKCEFQITKLDALQGGCMLKFVTEKLIPLIGGAQEIFSSTRDIDDEEEAVRQRTDNIMKIIPKALESISDKELIDFEKRCLRTVEINKPAGWQPVMIGDDFGVDEIAYDPIMALTLCYDVVEFNFGGFFGDKGLASVLPLQNSQSQNV